MIIPTISIPTNISAIQLFKVVIYTSITIAVINSVIISTISAHLLTTCSGSLTIRVTKVPVSWSEYVLEFNLNDYFAKSKFKSDIILLEYVKYIMLATHQKTRCSTHRPKNINPNTIAFENFDNVINSITFAEVIVIKILHVLAKIIIKI